MRYFPAFMDLQDQQVFITGGGELALRKARLLLGAGARLKVFGAAEEDPIVGELGGRIETAGRLDDLAFRDTPKLLVAATGDETEDERCARLARSYGVPVNAVDLPHLCDVVVPSIVSRGDLVVGISTGGAAPVIGRRLRERLEAMLPARLGDLIGFAKARRARAGAAVPAAQRRAFWEEVFGGPVAEAVLEGDTEEAEKLFGEALEGRSGRGQVHIVGAGPGDPELLTLKALRVCQEADVILHDALVTDEILALCRRDAERIYVGKKRAEHALPQEEIGALMTRLAGEGKRVVRLKGGDPFIFGRGGEELEALKAAGIPVSVVPGISAALGCAASAEIPLTHRGVSQSVTFVTAEGGNGKAPSTDWKALAAVGGTIVVYMGMSKAGEVASALLNAGLAPTLPVAVVAEGTRRTETIVRATLSDLGLAAGAVGAPGVIIIGETARKARGEEIRSLLAMKEAA
jgi:uroporphyrin-III C-methyltransferase/precorrin-2 dehydrogenase/sirohydrochlorin ferrochelatase